MPRTLRLVRAATLVLCVLLVTPQSATADKVADSQQIIGPLLAKHCTGCHGNETAESGLNLVSTSGELAAPLQDFKMLEKIAQRVRAQTMPPADAEAPLGVADREVLLRWLDEQIEASLGSEINPGRVTIRRLTRVDYRNTIRDLLGVTIDTSDFPSDDVAHGFDNLADVISLPPLLMERYADAAESIAALWYAAQIGNAPAKQPTASKPARQLAIEILLPLQERAFRRPTSELERHYLLEFFDTCQQQKYSYSETMQACVMRILVSPSFLYRIERDGPIGQDRPLDDFELATRLSYFLWSSMPDEELFDLARRGQLQQANHLAQQIKRMLQDEKVRTGLVENFAGQWLQIQRLEAIRPDRKAFPEFDESLRQAMQAETLKLFETIICEDRPFSELLNANYTFVNQRLAQHYGIEGIQGEELQRVSLADSPRRGVLTHASILAINAHPTRTSPVLRGKWILEAVLGTPPPPPPADAGELEAVEVEGTLRERLEAHRSNSRCASCHKRMDTLGLAFEHYDAIGSWRDHDAGAAIDASGELADIGKFDSALELVDRLHTKQLSQFRKNLAERMLIYALGRTLTMYDRLPLRRIVNEMADHDDRPSHLVAAILASEPFRLRRNPGRIGIEGLPEAFLFDLQGNPDQQSVLKLRRNPHAQPPAATHQVAFELHTLKPLLSVGTANGTEVKVGQAEGGPATGSPYRYPLTAPLDEPIYLSFLKGMITPQESSEDFLKPIAFVAESDKSRIEQIATSSHKWNGSLVGPGHIRPGSLVAFDFDVRLVAKETDQVQVFLATAGAANTSMFENSGGFRIEGEGTHRFTQVCRRKANMLDAWNNVINLVVRTRTQTVVGNVSPLRVVRPQLGLSDRSPIRFRVKPGQLAKSPPRRIFNAQKTTIADEQGNDWQTILYGTASLTPDAKRPYIVDSDGTGALLLGEHADRFEIVATNAAENGRGLKLVGADGELGLAGGPDAEEETFHVGFRGVKRKGTYRATLRVVTQAGGEGTLSTGRNNEPLKNLFYVDIPIEAQVQ